MVAISVKADPSIANQGLLHILNRADLAATPTNLLCRTPLTLFSKLFTIRDSLFPSSIQTVLTCTTPIIRSRTQHLLLILACTIVFATIFNGA